jgi:hypothetical protein
VYICVVCCSVFIVLVIVHCSSYCALFLSLCSFATLTEVLRAFSLVVRQMQGYNSQDGARPALPNFPITVLFFYLCIMRAVCG